MEGIQKSERRGYISLKKIKARVEEARKSNTFSTGCVKLMFQDEAGFGRINKPKKCWAPGKIRPCVPCHHICEYRYTYGAVEPATGDDYFYIYNRCDTVCMEHFLNGLSSEFPNDHIILCCDGAGWHKNDELEVPDNIELIFIPPYTPEMNPIEQIWEELREKGFRNEVSKTLADVVDRLCDAICNLTKDTFNPQSSNAAY